MSIYRIGFLMSQNLGHIVHDQRLRLEIAQDSEIQADWMPIHPWAADCWQKLPVIKNNLTLLGGLRAKKQLSRGTKQFDAIYCHTQEAATLLGKYMKRTPTILSMDATPINIDSIGDAYAQAPRGRLVESVKHVLTRRAFDRAAHLVTFSQWAKNSLIRDYGIPERKITVNTPGVDLRLWNVKPYERPRPTKNVVSRVLFVGGDFRRKGGEILMRCAALMRGECQIDVVTGETVPDVEGAAHVNIHRGIKGGTPELLALYRRADMFVLPTLGDCSPWVIMEAMATGLPVISTRVGGIPEVVTDGETGLLVPKNSPAALAEAIRTLTNDPALRRAMGMAGRRRIERHFDGARSYRALTNLIKNVVTGSAGVGAFP